MRLCSVQGCNRQHYARDFCHTHYEANRRDRLGVPDRPWTSEERKFLEAHYGTVSSAAIAIKLNRTVSAVYSRAYKITFISKRDDGRWSTTEVAEIFGVTRRTVGGWILRGWLRGYHNGRRMLRIADADIYRFIDRQVDSPPSVNAVQPQYMPPSEYRDYLESRLAARSK